MIQLDECICRFTASAVLSSARLMGQYCCTLEFRPWELQIELRESLRDALAKTEILFTILINASSLDF